MAVNFILLLVLGIVCYIDIKTKLISNWITITGMLTGLIYNHFGLNSILGIITGILSVHLLNTIRIFRVSGGDAKLFGMLGAFLGWQAVLIIYGMSIILMIPHKIYRIAKGKRGSFVYSPFITMASLILFIYGS